jgi:hypothetical protein
MVNRQDARQALMDVQDSSPDLRLMPAPIIPVFNACKEHEEHVL